MSSSSQHMIKKWRFHLVSLHRRDSARWIFLPPRTTIGAMQQADTAICGSWRHDETLGMDARNATVPKPALTWQNSIACRWTGAVR